MTVDIREARTRSVVIDKPHQSWDVPAKAVLTPLDPGHGLPPVFLVTLDEVAADRYKPGLDAGQVLGGITRTSNGKWAVVAYRDRQEWLNGGTTAGFMPIDADNQAHAVRMLIKWWRITLINTDYDVNAQDNRFWRYA